MYMVLSTQLLIIKNRKISIYIFLTIDLNYDTQSIIYFRDLEHYDKIQFK